MSFLRFCRRALPTLVVTKAKALGFAQNRIPLNALSLTTTGLPDAQQTSRCGASVGPEEDGLACQLVPIPASLPYRMRDAPVVFPLRDRIEMGWVDAGRIAAEVVQHETGWNWASQRLVDGSMRQQIGVAVLPANADVPVAVAESRSDPDPTLTIGHDLRGRLSEQALAIKVHWSSVYSRDQL